MRYIPQKLRTVIWLIYLVIIFCFSFALFKTPLPPTAEKGVWFYSCLASVLLGDLITNPYFTSPADSISNTTAALISILAVTPFYNSENKINSALWWLMLLFNLIILLFSILQITTKNTKSLNDNKISQVLYKITTSLGSHKFIFSTLVIYALYSFHIDNPEELFLIGLVSGLIIVVHPLEKIFGFLINTYNIISINELNQAGEIVGYAFPNLIKIKSQSGTTFKFGDKVVFRGDSGKSGLGCVLDQIGFTDEIWLRIITLNQDIQFNIKPQKKFRKKPETNVMKIDDDQIINDETNDYVEKIQKHLIGIVAPNSNINKIVIELVRTDIDINEGRLIKTTIGSENVLYQIINGLTKEEIIEQKNNRGFVHAEAQKIGVWKEGGLKWVGWVPSPNTPVFIIDTQNPDFMLESIGFMPQTNYHISIDINTLVTHNAAILGILGIGKTCLALEFIERMISNKIKVICLDLTDEYEKQLLPFVDSNQIKNEMELLNKIGACGKDNKKINVWEGGSINEFKNELKTILGNFISEENDSWLKIFNPASFTIWQQTGKVFNNDAPMALLTPCEITRVFSEVTLEILQSMGITQSARCCIVYEEAHSLVPEWTSVAYEGDKAATNGSAKAILQGRKYGLGCLLITQRTANVTKSILNQCNTVIALRTIDKTGLDFLKDYFGTDYTSLLPTLGDRQAIIHGKASSNNIPVLIRLNDREKFLDNFRNKNNAIGDDFMDAIGDDFMDDIGDIPF